MERTHLTNGFICGAIDRLHAWQYKIAIACLCVWKEIRWLFDSSMMTLSREFELVVGIRNVAVNRCVHNLSLQCDSIPRVRAIESFSMNVKHRLEKYISIYDLPSILH